ncbi:hypothetical protein PHSC3_002020 [Chlamydiales bacterium STE3]|nr:hypothetical protein PHSC3_002020 [Chlamydiales bacterium STE3]
MMRALVCLVFFNIAALNADSAVLKMASNVPVFYELNIEGDAKSDGKNPKINFKDFNIDIEFSIMLRNEPDVFPELVIVPKKIQGQLIFNHGSANFDFSKESLTFNSIIAGALPFLNSIKLNQPLRVAITDNENFLNQTHGNYPYLPIKNREGYANFAKKILDFIANGYPVKQRGRFRTVIPELGLEVFSNEKVLDNQFKGDYTFRFLHPLDTANGGCNQALMGGGKVRNSALTNHILNTRANGIFILIFQKVNCPKKELDERYEFRGKLKLQPKSPQISYSV